VRRSTRRLLWLAACVPLFLLVFAWIYQQGMSHVEGSPRTFGQSVEFVSETLTTTGYGADNRWSSPMMQVFVVCLQFLGLAISLLVFPIFVIPFLEERFEQRLPRILPELDGAVVVYRWGPAVAPLVEELGRHKVPVVILEEDLAVARRLHEKGHVVVHTQLEEEDLDFSRLLLARGVVAAGDDPGNAVLTLAARQNGFKGPIAALVESPTRRSAMQRAGANAVFTPGHILAAAIAARTSDKISPRVSGVGHLGKHVEIAEVRVDKASAVAGKSLAESGLRAQTGATIIGWWKDGELRPPPGPTEKLDIGAILVAAGSELAIEKLGKLATPVARKGCVLVVGHDEVAKKVAEFLEGAGETVRRVWPYQKGDDSVPGGAFGGDPLDPAVLEKGGLREARAVVLALDTDGETLFAAALARDLAPEAMIVAAARRAENVGRIRRAGADFALSVGQVAGQLLGFQLLGEETVSLEAEIKVVRAAAGELADTPLADARIRERTGCSIVAIERGEEVIADFGADFRMRPDDALYVSGTGDAVDRFFATYSGTHADV
jgi:Trk K+ transport system NAD-binding subunit